MIKNTTIPLFVKLYAWYCCATAILYVLMILYVLFALIKGEPINYSKVVLYNLDLTWLLFPVSFVIFIGKGILAYFILRQDKTAIKIGLYDAIITLIVVLGLNIYPFLFTPESPYIRTFSLAPILIGVYLYYMVQLNKRNNTGNSKLSRTSSRSFKSK